MDIFDDFKRTNNDKSDHDSSTFSFINNSAWPIAEYIRNILQQWVGDFPVDKDFIARFRSDNDKEHRGALFELIVYSVLKNSGYDVEKHKPVDLHSTKAPDFYAMNDDYRFYTECTLSTDPFAPTNEVIQNKILSQIEIIESPKFYIGVCFVETSNHTPSLKMIISFLKEKLKELSQSSIEKEYGIGYLMEQDGWKIEFNFHPKHNPSSTTIGSISPGEGGFIDSQSPLLRALDEKRGSKYGNLVNPYIIAINSPDIALSEYGTYSALFGESSNMDIINPEKLQRITFLWGEKEPRNTRVSAVWIFKDIGLFSLDNISAELWHNPWARNTLSKKTLIFNQVFFHDLDKSGHLRKEKIEGRKIHTALDLDIEKFRNLRSNLYTSPSSANE